MLSRKSIVAVTLALGVTSVDGGFMDGFLGGITQGAQSLLHQTPGQTNATDVEELQEDKSEVKEVVGENTVKSEAAVEKAVPEDVGGGKEMEGQEEENVKEKVETLKGDEAADADQKLSEDSAKSTVLEAAETDGDSDVTKAVVEKLSRSEAGTVEELGEVDGQDQDEQKEEKEEEDEEEEDEEREDAEQEEEKEEVETKDDVEMEGDAELEGDVEMEGATAEKKSKVEEAVQTQEANATESAEEALVQAETDAIVSEIGFSGQGSIAGQSRSSLWSTLTAAASTLSLVGAMVLLASFWHGGSSMAVTHMLLPADEPEDGILLSDDEERALPRGGHFGPME